MATTIRQAEVFYNGKAAGLLTKTEGLYRFQYYATYLNDPLSRPVSITLPLREQLYENNMLFPAFINMLSEGANKRIQCRLLKIDENDYFSLLLAIVKEDNIGPVTLKEINELT